MKKIFYLLLSIIFTFNAEAVEKNIEILSATLSPAPEKGSSLLSLRIKNNSKEADQLIYVRSPSPDIKGIEFHAHLEEDGVMRMQKIRDINIPAGANLFLGSGTEHIMLYLNNPLYVGDKVKVSLTFKNDGSITLMVPVVGNDQ
ncbi:MAG TPA: copper chaperone PCu(A)C [Alphaproteobacteria bacterium]|nr:copper chaperone PCu(A)C [Alphaproteobacteria bacterium]